MTPRVKPFYVEIRRFLLVFWALPAIISISEVLLSDSLPEEPINVNFRRIYLIDDIEHASARQFIMMVDLLETESLDPIEVIMSSPGGMEEAGMAISNCLLNSKCYITIRVVGEACSIAAAILQAADWRIMMPNTTYMVHQGSVESGGVIKQDERIFRNAAQQIERNNDRYYNILNRSEAGIEKIKAWCQAETWFNPEEALKNGFIDEIGKPLKSFGPKRKPGRPKKIKHD